MLPLLTNHSKLTVHRALFSAFVFLYLLLSFSRTPNILAGGVDTINKVKLPNNWVENHGAAAVFGDSTPMWFDEFPSSEVNESPNLPTGIYFEDDWMPRDRLDLQELSQFHGLRWLADFDGRRLRTEAWKEIGKMTSLRALVVVRAELNDNTIKHLSSLKHLQFLDVSMTEITDASIPDLLAFKDLKMLNISGTKITLRGFERLRALNPKCAVYPDRWIYSEKMDPTWAREVLPPRDSP